MVQHLLILLLEQESSVVLLKVALRLFREGGSGTAQGAAATGEVVLLVLLIAQRCRWSILISKAWVIDSSALWSVICCVQEVSQVCGHGLDWTL